MINRFAVFSAAVRQSPQQIRKVLLACFPSADEGFTLAKDTE